MLVLTPLGIWLENKDVDLVMRHYSVCKIAVIDKAYADRWNKHHHAQKDAPYRKYTLNRKKYLQSIFQGAKI